MDFKRIEFIFFCAFLSLNLFLFYTYQQSRLDVAAEGEINPVTSVESRLRGDKIEFEGDFSREITQGYYLSGQSTDFTKTDLSSAEAIEHRRLRRSFPDSPTYYLRKNSPEADLLEFLTKDNQIYAQPEYTYLNRSGGEELQYVMAQEFEGIPFNDETSELVFEVAEVSATDLWLRSYTQAHLADIEPLREAQDVIGESEAIETLYMSNKIPSEGKIIRTELAYTRLFTVRDKNVYIPAWFIWLENTKGNIQVERINGFSNSIISANVPEVKK